MISSSDHCGSGVDDLGTLLLPILGPSLVLGMSKPSFSFLGVVVVGGGEESVSIGFSLFRLSCSYSSKSDILRVIRVSFICNMSEIWDVPGRIALVISNILAYNYSTCVEIHS